jgi:hypothetical protein
LGRVVGQRVARFETEIDEQSNRGNDVRTEASVVGTSVVHQCVGMIEMRRALSDFRAEFLVFTILILIIEDVAQNHRCLSTKQILY